MKKDIRMIPTDTDYYDIDFTSGTLHLVDGDEMISNAITKMLWTYPLKNGYGVGLRWIRGSKITPVLALQVRERILQSISILEMSYRATLPISSFSFSQSGDRLDIKLELGRCVIHG